MTTTASPSSACIGTERRNCQQQNCGNADDGAWMPHPTSPLSNWRYQKPTCRPFYDGAPAKCDRTINDNAVLSRRKTPAT
jgi:hypothetical protein